MKYLEPVVVGLQGLDPVPQILRLGGHRLKVGQRLRLK